MVPQTVTFTFGGMKVSGWLFAASTCFAEFEELINRLNSG